MLELTARQQQILNFIQDFIEAESFPPTRAEIADALGFRSVNAAEDHLKALVRKHAIEILPGMSRGIRVLQAGGGQRRRGLPIVGRVAAGHPILAAEHLEGHVRVDPGLFTPTASYMLRVSGMSMCNIGILDGDLLAVHRTTDVSNGQVVVARVEGADGEQGEVTVKRFRRRGNVVRLIAENDDFEPIVVDLREQGLAIEGIAVGVIRSGLG